MPQAMKQEIDQNATITWATDTTISADIERQGLLTQIDVTSRTTPSATLAGANQQGGLWRLAKGMRLIGGTRTYFGTPSEDGGVVGELLHYMNRQDGYGIGHPDGVITAPSQTFTAHTWTLHAGTRHKTMYGDPNPFDLSAFVPAALEQQLTFELDTSGNDVMDDTVTISSAVLVFTLYRVFGTDAEIKQEMSAQGVRYPNGKDGMVPLWSSKTLPLTGTTSDFESTTENLPVGGWLSRINVAAQDATADRPLRAGDELIGTALIVAGANERIYQTRHDHLTNHMDGGTFLEADDAALDFGMHNPKGIYLRDLRRYSTIRSPFGKDYGMNMTHANDGDFKLGLRVGTNTSGDDLLFIYERRQEWANAGRYGA